MIIPRFMLTLLPPWRMRKLQRWYVRSDIGGRKVLLPAVAGVGTENLKFRSSWKTQIIAAVGNLADGLFVDVGANVGQTLLDLQSVRPGAPYLGFEPNLSCVAYLHDLIQINEFPDCHIMPIGLHETHNVLPLFRNPGKDADSCATLVPNLRPQRQTILSYVPVFPFAGVNADIGEREIAFIKIDIEGAEDTALFGMKPDLERCRPIVLCEVLYVNRSADRSEAERRKNKLIRFLNELEYKVLQIKKSEDGRNVVDLIPIEHFGGEAWSMDNADLCDYLFVPSQKLQVVEKAILKTNSVR